MAQICEVNGPDFSSFEWSREWGRVKGSAFMGVVDGKKGSCRVQDENAVLLTLVVDDVDEWYTYLKDQEAALVTEVQGKEDIQIRCFFLRDPGGYALEVQQFLHPEVAQAFCG